MIELPKIDVHPPDETVRTEKVAKPEPETEPDPIYEMNTIFGPGLGTNGFDNGVLFSGGDDSLALVHLAMEEQDWGDYVVHFDTNSSIPENVDYVREICQEYQWPYFIISAPMDLFVFAARYGFPGPDQHTSAFNQFKGRQMNYLNKFNDGSMKLLSGVRKDESGRRLRNVSEEIQYANHNFDGWWVSPLAERSDEWVAEYREKHDLPQNPVSKKINRSGDCGCFAYGNRMAELVEVEAHYPDYANWIKNVERRVQEYRGREFFLEDHYPEIAKKVAKLRKESLPNPMKLTILKKHYPNIYKQIVDIETEEAILRGRQDNTNYIGHGGMSSKELRNLTSEADKNQKTLCDNCDKRCSAIVPTVQEQMESAKDQLNKTVQKKLGITNTDESAKVHRRMSQHTSSNKESEEKYSQTTLSSPKAQ